MSFSTVQLIKEKNKPTPGWFSHFTDKKKAKENSLWSLIKREEPQKQQAAAGGRNRIHHLLNPGPEDNKRETIAPAADSAWSWFSPCGQMFIRAVMSHVVKHRFCIISLLNGFKCYVSVFSSSSKPVSIIDASSPTVQKWSQNILVFHWRRHLEPESAR